MTTKLAPEPLVAIPVDDETRAMPHYATRPAGGARTDKARQAIRDGKGVSVGPGYLDEMNRRASHEAPHIWAGAKR